MLFTNFLSGTNNQKQIKTSVIKDKLIIEGLESLAKNMQERTRKIDELQQQQNQDKEILIQHIEQEKTKQENNGILFKTFLVNVGDDSNPGKVIYKNLFKKFSEQQQKKIKKFIPKKIYNILFKKKYELKLKNDSSITELKNILGDSFEKFFEEKSYITIQDEFMEKRFSLGNEIDLTNEDIFNVLYNMMNEVQYSPSISFK